MVLCPQDLRVHVMRQLTLVTLTDTEARVSLRNFYLDMLANHKSFL